MNKVLLLFVAITITINVSAQSGVSSSEEQKIKESVLNVRKSKLNAIMNNNMDSLNEVLSVNFKNEIPNGLRHNKESYMASLKKGHHQLHKILDYDINIEVINNNLAIISGLGETDRTQNSKREQTKIKFVDIYYNENGTWKSVFYTASVVK